MLCTGHGGTTLSRNKEVLNSPLFHLHITGLFDLNFSYTHYIHYTSLCTHNYRTYLQNLETQCFCYIIETSATVIASAETHLGGSDMNIVVF